MGDLVALNPGRLFTFGCSFTQYRWPTWADILGCHWHHYENWGQAGAGNVQILCSLMECDQRNSFTKTDTVIICLTGVMRFDRYINGKWQNQGCVSNDPLFADPKIYDALVDERGYLIRDLAAIKSMITLLSHKHTSWKILAMQPIVEIDYKNRFIDADDVVSLYRKIIKQILPSFTQVLGPDWATVPNDGHPLPGEHLRYLDSVLPGWVTDEQVRDWAMHYDTDTQMPSELGGLRCKRL